MPSSPNFGWTTPTPGGSSGAWGDILNDAIDAIDEAVYPTAGKLSECGLLDLTSAESQFRTAGVCQIDATGVFLGPGPSPVYVPIPFAKPGVRITAFTSRTSGSGAMTGTVSLGYVDNTGAWTQVSAGHATVSGAAADTTTSGLTHDVVTGRRYFIRIDCTGASGAINVVALTIAVQATP